jgi:o-succinylbenzoate synthase
MRIQRVELYDLTLPLVEPFIISGGTMNVRRSLVVVLHDGEGHRGYGEAPPFELPFYSEEILAGARHLLEQVLIPRVLGQELETFEEVDRLIRIGVRGNPFARAALDTAAWDLEAARRGVGMAALLAEKVGGKPAHELPCGVALGIPPDRSVDTLRRWIAEAVERGYRRVKIKVAPGWDAEPVAAARDALSGTELPLTVDANGGYEWPEHQGNLRALDAAGLLYIEQPLHPDELLGHARLAKTLHTQVCLDETLRDARAASQVVEAGGPLVWNVKVHRMGGLSEAARVVRIGLKHGARLWAGTMPESGLGSQAAIAAAALPGFVYPSDLEPSARWFGEGQDVIQLNMSPAGTMRAPECSIAALLDEERFHATAHRVLNLAAR